MRRSQIIILIVLIQVLLVACGGQDVSAVQVSRETEVEQVKDNSSEVSTPEVSTSEISTSESTTPENENTNENTSRILIAYFTWGENTVVDHPEEVDVDASTSASVLPPGNTGKLAGWIQEMTGGDIHKILTENMYSSDYDICLEEAADEKAQKARPVLRDGLENLDDYDVIYLGYPNWWYTTPMAIQSFVEEYDLSGKTVIPFISHGTGGLASCVSDLEDALPQTATVLEPIGVFRRDVDSAYDAVKAWHDGLDY